MEKDAGTMQAGILIEPQSGKQYVLVYKTNVQWKVFLNKIESDDFSSATDVY